MHTDGTEHMWVSGYYFLDISSLYHVVLGTELKSPGLVAIDYLYPLSRLAVKPCLEVLLLLCVIQVQTGYRRPFLGREMVGTRAIIMVRWLIG